MIINQENISLASQGFRVIFNNALSGAVLDDVGIQLAMVVPSNSAVETWGWLEKISGMRELIGEADIQNIAADSYTIPNKEWHDTVEIPQADYERDTYGKFKPLVSNMGSGSKTHDSKKIAELLMGGFVNKCYDGLSFFNTKHVYKGNNKVSYSNKLTSKLSAKSFALARKMLRTIPNAANDPMGISGDLYLVVSAQNESLAEEILLADKNDKGATNVNKGKAKIITWSAIDAKNSDAWFLVDLGQVTKPFIIQEESKVELIIVDDLKDSRVALTHKFIYQAYKRTGYGYGLPQLIVGSDGSTE